MEIDVPGLGAICPNPISKIFDSQTLIMFLNEHPPTIIQLSSAEATAQSGTE